LVTHNTAVLGILGVGKTYLALELVERMIEHGIKVVCLDLTNQYAEQLAPFYDASTQENKIKELKELGPAGKTNCQKNVEEGGSIGNFTKKLRQILTDFLSLQSSEKLAIYNPAEFEVWRQDSKPFQGIASMASLTSAQITRLFTEAVLEVLQGQGMTDKARCCLVYEEAHSLIPEWNAIVDEGDRAATNGTAKAILQGRKYGLGCLVVTQRTANVTKSILNQCNTVFALRVFDATGMDFLRNYIGDDYSGVLSTLEDRHAIFFGRASSCRDPVLIRLNDRADFIQAFRDQESAETGADSSALT
jgi:DNA helicase HerA-like ATPase